MAEKKDEIKDIKFDKGVTDKKAKTVKKSAPKKKTVIKNSDSYLCKIKASGKYVAMLEADFKRNESELELIQNFGTLAKECAITADNMNKKKNIEDDKKVTSHPQRYGGDTVYETIKVLKNWMTKEQYRGFCLGNSLKYLSRLGKKDEETQELDKTIFYLNKLKESYEEDK